MLRNERKDNEKKQIILLINRCNLQNDTFNSYHFYQNTTLKLHSLIQTILLLFIKSNFIAIETSN